MKRRPLRLCVRGPDHQARVEIQQERLVIQLADASGKDSREGTGNILHVPWQKANSTRRREMLLPAGANLRILRPIRSENRATLIASIARGRRWLDELIWNSTASTESIAKRESCSIRKVNMTISLAFPAPDLVRAAIEGRVPHGMGVARLTDLPAEWSRQYAMPRPFYVAAGAGLSFPRLLANRPDAHWLLRRRSGVAPHKAPPRRWSRPGRISGRPWRPKLTDRSRETGSIATACLARSSSPLSPTTHSDANRDFPVLGVRLQMVWDNLSCLGTEALARLG